MLPLRQFTRHFDLVCMAPSPTCPPPLPHVLHISCLPFTQLIFLLSLGVLPRVSSPRLCSSPVHLSWSIVLVFLFHLSPSTVLCPCLSCLPVPFLVPVPALLVPPVPHPSFRVPLPLGSPGRLFLFLCPICSSRSLPPFPSLTFSPKLNFPRVPLYP